MMSLLVTTTLGKVGGREDSKESLNTTLHLPCGG